MGGAGGREQGLAEITCSVQFFGENPLFQCTYGSSCGDTHFVLRYGDTELGCVADFSLGRPKSQEIIQRSLACCAVGSRGNWCLYVLIGGDYAFFPEHSDNSHIILPHISVRYSLNVAESKAFQLCPPVLTAGECGPGEVQ